ncbi:chitobiase/beta-hexosaminidase C-terminal domain-containing protein, partial [candidate division KSB1 bacterium]|nr:chitobiase/beta-hexosaminidase C-terminal domain-containing protein [candidate division KSB1 bacterium]
CSDSKARICYTLDGSEPDEHSPDYVLPIVLEQSCVLRAIAVRPGALSAAVAEAVFSKRLAVRQIALFHPPAPDYSAEGEQTLLDGVRGSKNQSDGKWLGFERVDFGVEIDLGRPQKIRRLALGLLNKPDAGIFYPNRIQFFASNDGHDYHRIAELDESLVRQMTCCDQQEFGVEPADLGARYVRIRAENVDRSVPGKKAWLFIDQLFIE